MNSRGRWLFALAVLGLFLSGCGGKEVENTAVPPPTSNPGGMAEKVASPLQQEAERPESFVVTLEMDPTQRPLVTSEKAGSRREWRLATLEKGYQKTGKTSPRWDNFARTAFRAYTDYTLENKDEHFRTMVNGVTNAVREGCTDPMIHYMYARYRLDPEFREDIPFAIACLRAHEEVFKSDYHPLYKMQVGIRACEYARDADPKAPLGVRYSMTLMGMEDLARDSNAPVADVFNQADELLHYTRGKGWVERITASLEDFLEKNWGNEERCLRWPGDVELARAWDARGGGFVNTVTEEGWQGFREHQDKAEKLLTKAWALNPKSYKTAYLMMRLELGQGKGLPVMRQWFDRAMALSPDSIEAAAMMAFYLEPRWHGDEKRSLEFARSCVESKVYGGEVPRVLASAHRSLATYYKLADSPKYWQKPHVWPDVEASWEKFFKLNPQATSWRHDYARDAYLCGKYRVFLEQAKLFNGHTNFVWFGGKEVWDGMVSKAAENLARH